MNKNLGKTAIKRLAGLAGFLFLGSYGTTFLRAQRVGVHTNTLYWLTTTPNAGLDFQIGQRSTLGFTLGYNPFLFPSYVESGKKHNPKLKHWFFVPEYKYWFCRPYERWFVGVYGLYGAFNIEGFPFIKADSDRYEGIAGGCGISAGYQWALGREWGLEVSAGAGYTYVRYDKYDCGPCGAYNKQVERHWIGPNKLAVSFIYFLR